MNKKGIVIAVVLLTIFTVGAIFAETFQCKDPADGSVKITYSGSTVYASYSGKSRQSFDVFVKTINGGKVVSFSFAASKNAQTRIQDKDAGAEVIEVTNCSFKSY
jgi:transposase-like protein